MTSPMKWTYPLTVLLGFVREKANESSTRLVMLILGITACQVSLATVAYVFVRNAQVHALELLAIQAQALGKPVPVVQADHGVSMVVALTGLVTALVVNGCVVIAMKTRRGGEPGDAVSPPIPPMPPGPQP